MASKSNWNLRIYDTDETADELITQFPPTPPKATNSFYNIEGDYITETAGSNDSVTDSVASNDSFSSGGSGGSRKKSYRSRTRLEKRKK